MSTARGRSAGGFRRHRLGAIGAASLLALTTVAATGPVTSAQSQLQVQVGVGDGTVAGQAFLPGTFSVVAGDSVTFAIGSDQPHTITLGTGPADAPPPFWPASGFEAPSPDSPPPYDLGTTSFDGTNFVNTGVLAGKGSSATVTFSTSGTFPFFCAIHPGMAGEVEVLESGTATTQAEADAAAAQTSEALLGAVDQVRADRLAATTTVDNADGSQTWNVFVDAGTDVGPMPGGGSGFLELLEFTPAGIPIAPGDTVTWTATYAHTVTFVPEGEDPATLFASEEALIAPMGGPTYDGTAAASSGILGFALPPATEPATQFSLTFPTEGVYPFFCLLHVELGQMGTVAVGVPLPGASG